MTDFADLLPVAHEAVDLASNLMRTMQPGILTAKGDRDVASEVDYAIEREVRAFLAAKTPDIGFLGEEEGTSGATTDLMWALDPIDGTVNFVHGSPLCGVSLGLITQQRSVLGVIDLPFLGSRYYATEGTGAHANGQRIHISDTADLSDAVVAIGDYAIGTDAQRRNVPRLAITNQLSQTALRVRMHGSAAIDLTWLAHGKLDALIMLSNRPWDTSAGVIIAREAGADVVDQNGVPHSFTAAATIATSERLLPAILALVREATSGASTPNPKSRLVAPRVRRLSSI